MEVSEPNLIIRQVLIMAKYLKNMKKTTRKRIKIWWEDVWDKPGGGCRKGERAYRKMRR